MELNRNKDSVNHVKNYYHYNVVMQNFIIQFVSERKLPKSQLIHGIQKIMWMKEDHGPLI